MHKRLADCRRGATAAAGTLFISASIAASLVGRADAVPAGPHAIPPPLYNIQLMDAATGMCLENQAPYVSDGIGTDNCYNDFASQRWNLVTVNGSTTIQSYSDGHCVTVTGQVGWEPFMAPCDGRARQVWNASPGASGSQFENSDGYECLDSNKDGMVYGTPGVCIGTNRYQNWVIKY
ncbi:RICIN domain-containing protein [Actinoallomurus vinaceus]